MRFEDFQGEAIALLSSSPLKASDLARKTGATSAVYPWLKKMVNAGTVVKGEDGLYRLPDVNDLSEAFVEERIAEVEVIEMRMPRAAMTVEKFTAKDGHIVPKNGSAVSGDTSNALSLSLSADSEVATNSRYARRQISQKEKLKLLQMFDYKCAECDCSLWENDWEADHIQRWADTHYTNIWGMQPLCVPCHRKKTAMENRAMNGIEVDMPRLRRGTAEALDKAYTKLIYDHERFFSLVLPTRYGKSHTARLISMAAVLGIPSLGHKPYAAFSVFLCSTSFLVRQINSPEKWKGFVSDLKYQGVSPRFRTITKLGAKTNRAKRSGISLRPNNEHFLASTIQLITNSTESLQAFIDWLNMETMRCGKPPIIWFDEAHQTSHDNEWGQALIKIACETNAKIITMTATPFRADNQLIPGFDAVLDRVENSQQSLFKPLLHKPDYILKETYDQVIRYLKQTADVYVPFRESFEEGFLCKFNFVPVQVDLTKSIGEEIEGSKWLHELSKTEAKKIIGKLLKHPLVISAMVSRGLECLYEIRKHHGAEKAAMVIFTGNDEGEDKGNDKHANDFKDEILRQHPGLKIAIATMNSDKKIKETGEINRGGSKSINSSDLLENFDNTDFDVIIMKTMGAAGWDTKRVKVEIYATSIRTIATTIQATTRVGTPWKIGGGSVINVGSVIHLDEPLYYEAIEPLISYTEAVCKDIESELVGEELIKKKESNNPEFFYLPEKGVLAGFSDESGNQTNNIALVDFLMEEIPDICKNTTKAALAAKVEQHFQVESKDSARKPGDTLITSIDHELLLRHKAINDSVRSFSGGLTSTFGNFETAIKTVWTHIKEHFGIPEDEKFPSSCDDLELLKRVEIYVGTQLCLQNWKKSA